jgi:DNA-directed RNA polymerase subunit H (RpoH/RPB5)
MWRLKWLPALIAFALYLTPVCGYAVEDSVTLNSGEIMEGRIVSDTDSAVKIEVHNANRTVFATRTIPRSDIKEIHILTPEQRQEIEAYNALQRYKLNPNQELNPASYADGIAAFDGFLAAYPRSEYGAKVTDQRAQWQFEKHETEAGHVKFGGKWMTPDERVEQLVQKQVQVIKAAQARVEAAQKEHDFLHSEAGYAHKVLPHPEYEQVMARYAANDAEIPKAHANLDAAMAKFSELYGEYQKAGGKVNYQEQIEAK